MADTEARRNQWLSMITDDELEQELRLFISRPENRDAVLKEVSDVYDEILQGRRIDELFPRWLWCKKKKGWSDTYHEKVQEIVCRLDSENALCIMMAKRGKFPSYKALCGAQQNLTTWILLQAYVFKWCADELKRHGVEEEFYFPNNPVGHGHIAGSDKREERMGWKL